MSFSKIVKMLIVSYLCTGQDSLPIPAGKKSARALPENQERRGVRHFQQQGQN